MSLFTKYPCPTHIGYVDTALNSHSNSMTIANNLNSTISFAIISSGKRHNSKGNCELNEVSRTVVQRQDARHYENQMTFSFCHVLSQKDMLFHSLLERILFRWTLPSPAFWYIQVRKCTCFELIHLGSRLQIFLVSIQSNIIGL